MRAIDSVIIHCTATRPEWLPGRSVVEKRDQIARWHRARGWRDIGYHYLIDRNGGIAIGRLESEIGAHTKGENRHSIGVALIGGFGAGRDDDFTEHFTLTQQHQLLKLIQHIQARHEVQVYGHNEFAPKACPGFQVGRWMDGLL